jgi:mRNA interferase RelE/StbE
MYTIDIEARARRGIRKLPQGDQRRIDSAITSLSAHPRPHGVAKVRGFQRRYRIRVRDYRIVYDIYDDQELVVIVDVDQRKDIYR